MNKKFSPNETINKALLTSTCKFIGEFKSSSAYLTHAWMSFSDPRNNYVHEETPVTRNAFIFIFETKPYDYKAGVTVPDYTFVSNNVCSYLSLLFGKRFDSHGLIESVGHYQFPNLSNGFNSFCNNKLPFNSFNKRKTLPIDLNLKYFEYFEKMFFDNNITKKFGQTFNTCCKFYSQALQTVEFDPEIAYLNLITAGEVLSNYFDYTKESLIDPDMLSILESIQLNLNDGVRIRNIIESKIRSIKSKYINVIMKFIDDDFFHQNSIVNHYGCFKKDDFEGNIKASYDLRSKFTHTGLSFGKMIKPDQNYNDLQIGQPVTGDKDIDKILAKAPLFSGLEKVIRYALLKFYESETSTVIIQAPI